MPRKIMTVQELVESLSAFGPNTPVLIGDPVDGGPGALVLSGVMPVSFVPYDDPPYAEIVTEDNEDRDGMEIAGVTLVGF